MIMQRFSTCLIFFYCVTPSIKWPISQPQSTVVAKYGFEQENVCHPLQVTLAIYQWDRNESTYETLFVICVSIEYYNIA